MVVSTSSSVDTLPSDGRVAARANVSSPPCATERCRAPRRTHRTLFGAIVAAFFLAGSCTAAIQRDGVVLPFKEVRVSAAVAGTLRSVDVKEGDVVRAGQMLAQIDSRQQQLEVDRLAKIVEKRRFDFEGFDALLKDSMTSRDQAMQARIELEIAELDQRRAQAELEKRVLLSPLDGLVVAVRFEAGEWVEPGAIVAEVVDIGSVLAQLLLTAEEAGAVKLGLEVPLTFPALPNFTARGKIEFIDPRVDPSSGFQRVRVLVENRDGVIRPGLRCVATLPETRS